MPNFELHNEPVVTVAVEAAKTGVSKCPHTRMPAPKGHGAGHPRHALLLGVALALTGAPAMATSLPSPIAGQNYVQTFGDNFTTPDWDHGTATTGIKWYNWEQCCMTTTNGTGSQGYPDSVGVNPYSLGVNGQSSGLNIKLTLAKNTWVTGVLASTNSAGTKGFSQKYGYFDAMVKMSAGPATWPAFWFESPGNQKQNNEVDIEFYGSTPNQLYYTLHDWSGCGCTVAQAQKTGLPDLTAGFHDYGMLWTPQTVSFYIDGKLSWSTPTPSDLNVPMAMFLDNGIGNGQKTNGQTSGADFQIQYVRAYALQGSSAATPGPMGESLNRPLSPSSVPEASTWAMMLSGFAILGLAGYRSTRKTSARAVSV